jgi:hypothetical protein
VLAAKVTSAIQNLGRRYGPAERVFPVPPPASADAAVVAAVATKNSQLVASIVLGLHGPPVEGIEAAKRLVTHFVDWNEVRVSRPQTLIVTLGKQTRTVARVVLMQRFLEAFFLRQRNLNLDYLYTIKTMEVRRFLSDLEVFDREELAAMLLTGFGLPVFPPSDLLRDVAEGLKLIRPKTTTLQMAKKFEDLLDAQTQFSLYSHLYSLAYDPDRDKILKSGRSHKS